MSKNFRFKEKNIKIIRSLVLPLSVAKSQQRLLSAAVIEEVYSY